MDFIGFCNEKHVKWRDEKERRIKPTWIGGPVIFSILSLLLSNEGRIVFTVGTECLVLNNASSLKNMNHITVPCKRSKNNDDFNFQGCLLILVYF